jgi:hypothetical protein
MLGNGALRKKRGLQAFSCQPTQSAPNREMATWSLSLEKKRHYCHPDRVMARWGE